MTRQSRFVNPFFLALLVAGSLFAITATAYGVMTIRGARAESVVRQEISPAGTRLLQWMDRHGVRLMFGELVALAICTFAAIYSDDFWIRRWQRKQVQLRDKAGSAD